MRGLKQSSGGGSDDSPSSHLLQMRGLKQIGRNTTYLKTKSHLLQMRGLKLWFLVWGDFWVGRIFYRCVDWNPVLAGCALMLTVASFTDAWIETSIPGMERYYIESHLLQMRGLKLIATSLRCFTRLSHLLQMRGLKLRSHKVISNVRSVASFTDAWIETYFDLQERTVYLCRIFYRCVDWNKDQTNIFGQAGRRIFYRCVDWNTISSYQLIGISCRIFYRCVDWNRKG